MLANELLTYLFDGQAHVLAEPMEAWFASSRRFTAFVNDNQNKIRKKLRTAQEAERLRDLQLELETAYLLLQEKSLSVAYEPQHPELGRSPDFAVRFTTSLTFMVEVTRLKPSPPADIAPRPSSHEERFIDMLCSKLGQLLPQRANVLLVGMEAGLPALDEIRAMLIGIQQRAEVNDSTIVPRHGFRDRADFFRYYQRLSGLLVRAIPLQGGESAALWINPQAKYPLPGKVVTALSRTHWS